MVDFQDGLTLEDESVALMLQPRALLGAEYEQREDRVYIPWAAAGLGIAVRPPIDMPARRVEGQGRLAEPRGGGGGGENGGSVRGSNGGSDRV